MATGYICYNKKSYDGTRALGWVVITWMCIYRTVLMEQLFSNFSSFFFQEKQEKQEKQETFPQFGNLTEGKTFGRLRIPICGKKNWKTWKYKKLREKSLVILTKSPSVRRALSLSTTNMYNVYSKHHRKLYQVGCSRATVQRAKKRMKTDHHAPRITHHRTTQHIAHNT